MKINLKQNIKEGVLQHMKDNDIDAECMESIDLTKEEMKRGIKEGSVKTYYTYGLLIPRAGYPAMKINDKVIPVYTKGE
jgi:hypothetical protein